VCKYKLYENYYSTPFRLFFVEEPLVATTIAIDLKKDFIFNTSII